MRTVQQTDLHCELTGLSVLRGLSGKPEPACLKTEADSELLSSTLKSLTISSLTGISESLYDTATVVQHCDLTRTNIQCMQVWCTPAYTQTKNTQWVLDISPAFGFAKPQPTKLFCVFQSQITHLKEVEKRSCSHSVDPHSHNAHKKRFSYHITYKNEIKKKITTTSQKYLSKEKRHFPPFLAQCNTSTNVVPTPCENKMFGESIL